MTYGRRSHWYNNDTYDTKTTVFIHWSIKAEAYSIKFRGGNWKTNFPLMQPMFSYIKSLPSTKWLYNPEEKVWYLASEYIDKLKVLIECAPDNFEIDFVEKLPEGSTFDGKKYVPPSTYFDIFRTLTAIDISQMPYDEAKKVYRKMCLKYHPDVYRPTNGDNGGNGNDVNPMSSINECWTNLEISFYKQRKEQEYNVI